MGVSRITPMIATAALTIAAVPPSAAFVMPPSSSVIVRPQRGIVIAASTARRGGYGASRRGGTALQMNLADRFLRVAKANLNNILQNFEDPEKILEQAVEDMQKDLVKVRQSYAEVSAGQKRMERQKAEAERLANSWYERAQLALQSGDESLAREALSRRQQQTDTVANFEQQLVTQVDALDKLRESTQQLEAKITEARSQKDNLIARARTAKTTNQVNDMLGNISGTTSVDAFDRMQQKVEALEASAEVSGEIAGTISGSLEGQFKALEGASAVDLELAKMKGALPEKSGPRPELTTKEVESDLDQLKREMGSS